MSHLSRPPIVVGVDGSDACRVAVRWAAAQARRRGTWLRVVQACEIPVGYPTGIVDVTVLRDALAEQGREYLAQARNDVAAAVPELHTEFVQEKGLAETVLVKDSRDAAQLVLGTRGLGALTGLLVGSTAVAVIGRARCPVVVVRSQHDEADARVEGSVVVGVDGTSVGEAAIGFAFEEASARGCDLVAVHAWTDLLIETALTGGAATLDFEPLRQRAEEVLSERLAGWQEKYPDVRITREVVRDRPTHALLRHAKGAQLVVVGSRGRGGFRGLVLGSTSQHLLHHAPCPVAVVRT